MANIYFMCYCKRVLAVAEAGVGRTIQCPDCGQSLHIPRPEIQWNCACGETLLAPKSLAVEHVECVECGQQVAVPAGEAASPQCPSCGAAVQADHVICLNCGLNFKTGKKIQTVFEDMKGRKKRARLAGLAVSLLVLLGIVVAFWPDPVRPPVVSSPVESQSNATLALPPYAKMPENPTASVSPPAATSTQAPAPAKAGESAAPADEKGPMLGAPDSHAPAGRAEPVESKTQTDPPLPVAMPRGGTVDKGAEGGRAVPVAAQRLPGAVAVFDFKNGMTDSSGHHAVFRGTNISYAEHGLFLNGQCWNHSDTNGYVAYCATPDLNDRAFSVVIKFYVISHGPRKNNIIMGGRGSRWFGLSISPQQNLVITMNNQRFVQDIANAFIAERQWYCVACSVDMENRKLTVFFNGRRATIDLPEEVVADFKQAEKEWTFTNYATGSVMHGYVDELIVLNGLLSAEEYARLFPVPAQTAAAERSASEETVSPREASPYRPERESSVARRAPSNTVTEVPVVVASQPPPETAKPKTDGAVTNGLALSPYWNPNMSGGSRGTDDLSELLTPFGTPAIDLNPDPAIKLYEGLTYLMPLKDALQALNQRLATRNPVTTPGFPANTLNFYRFNGRFQGGFSQLLLVTDSRDQLVAVQLLDDSPSMSLYQAMRQGTEDYQSRYYYSSGMNNNTQRWFKYSKKWHYYNFIQASSRSGNNGIGHYCVLRDKVLRIDTDFIVQGNESYYYFGPRDNTEFNEYSVVSKQRVRLYLPQPMVNLVLYRLANKR